MAWWTWGPLTGALVKLIPARVVNVIPPLPLMAPDTVSVFVVTICPSAAPKSNPVLTVLATAVDTVGE